jgi:hypothetical protein
MRRGSRSQLKSGLCAGGLSWVGRIASVMGGIYQFEV